MSNTTLFSFGTISQQSFVSVTFWILALDHDLRLVRGELAYVALSDPAGTKVTIWDQLSMDEGESNYFIRLLRYYLL